MPKILQGIGWATLFSVVVLVIYLLAARLADNSPAARYQRLVSSDTTTHQDSTKPKIILSTVKIPGVTVTPERPDTMKRYVDSLIARAKKADTLEALFRSCTRPYRVTYEDSVVKAVVYCEPITQSARFDTILVKPVHFQAMTVTNTFEVEKPVPWYKTPTAVVIETLGVVYLVSEVSQKLRE